jgi:hypothetical protein
MTSQPLRSLPHSASVLTSPLALRVLACVCICARAYVCVRPAAAGRFDRNVDATLRAVRAAAWHPAATADPSAALPLPLPPGPVVHKVKDTAYLYVCISM